MNVNDAQGKKIGESRSSFASSGTSNYQPVSNFSSSYISTHQGVSNNSGKPEGTRRAGSRNELLSSQIYANVSQEALRNAVATSHKLTADEAKAYAKLCVSLLEKANIKTDGTVFSKRTYEKKVRYGFLNLKSRKKVEVKFIPGEAYWQLKCQHENEERSWCDREEKYIWALTRSGKFYDGEIREDYLHGGGYVMQKNDWKECETYQFDELVALLDLRLKKHNIKMSSGLFWMQCHPRNK